MPEYIEREALLEEARKRAKAFSSVLIYEAIKQAPTADVVEVVRCKDCKHGQWDNYYGQRRGVICEYNQDKIMPFNHFCANGKRIGDTERAE